jgi:hypothetical protein
VAQSTLYGSQTPATPNANDATAYTMGTRFAPNTNGWATHGRWYFPATLPTSTVSVGIIRDSDQVLLGSTTFSAPMAGAWNTAAYASPIELASGVNYSAVIWTSDRYVATAAYPWPTGAGNVISAGTAAGRFTASGSPFTFPTNNANGCYFADLVFETELAEEIAPSGIAVPVSLGSPTLSMVFEGTVLPSGIAVPVALGSPALAFTEGPPPAPGSWDTLSGIVREARSDHERNQERIANPIDCPEHGWPLDGRHCLFGGHVV